MKSKKKRSDVIYRPVRKSGANQRIEAHKQGYSGHITHGVFGKVLTARYNGGVAPSPRGGAFAPLFLFGENLFEKVLVNVLTYSYEYGKISTTKGERKEQTK